MLTSRVCTHSMDSQDDNNNSDVDYFAQDADFMASSDPPRPCN